MLPSPMRALGRRQKNTPPDDLHMSVLTGRIKRIKTLLKKGVHIESVNNLGQTPLFCAAFGGDVEVVALLLRLGANPNRKCGSKKATPVHAAAYRGSRKVLRLLVDTGADLSVRDKDFLTPRDYALKQPSPVRRDKILEYYDLLYAMTLHRTHYSRSTSRFSTLSSISSAGDASSTLRRETPVSTLPSVTLNQNKMFGSQMSLSRKSSLSSVNLWNSCVSAETTSPSVHHLHVSPPSIVEDNELVPSSNLHKSVSCHLLDQLCVTTSLPLLSPTQLQKPLIRTPAYTCGGPTVYSSFSWIGTPVTVRRPTPALSLSRQSDSNDASDWASPDQDAVKSLLQELAFLRRLRHPGFLEVMAACHVTHPSPDHVTLVFENVPYGSLYHHLHEQHRDLSIGSAVDILINLVEALLFMHGHRWLHCGLSSHAIHLVSLGAAKLGGFENAIECQAKGCGMRAEHLTRATWLRPWQPPETISEKMVSVKSDVYSVASIIWEIWSGMPPWSGIEDEEVGRRVTNGESLPKLSRCSAPSLITYVTEYGLKWDSHEREIDLQEVHTMLRSLRIQCDEDERVPAVTVWGPPSIPNTPVIGRHKKDTETVSSEGSQNDFRKGRGWEENTAIKPASHQLTRHSSSCSLASGPPSPSHQGSYSLQGFLPSAYARRIASSQGSLPTSPSNSNSKANSLPSRPVSLNVDQTDGGPPCGAAVRSHSRRHSENLRAQRGKRHRRRHEVEVEEEFIDDEFNALLYDQPHMQLSIGSSENLLDSRLSMASLQAGGDSESSSMSGGQYSQVTSSEEDAEEDPRSHYSLRSLKPSRSRPLKALAETGDSDNADDEPNSLHNPKSKQNNCENNATVHRNESVLSTPQATSSRLEVSSTDLTQSRSKTNSSRLEATFSNSIQSKNEKTSSQCEDSKPDTTERTPSRLKSVTSNRLENDKTSCISESESDDEVFSRNKTKEFDSLNSYKVMKNLRKDFNNYLPTYSLGSDTDSN